MECKNCKYYMEVKAESGYCHRFPPAMKRTQWPTLHEKIPDSYFPPVYAISWCGEFDKKVTATKSEAV